MNRARLLILVAGLAATAMTAAETGLLHPQLEAFRPMLGKTFRGEFANSTPEAPVFDVVRYERALNGQAIRSLHAINDGVYGGETIIRWDSATESLVFYYFTTQGFVTTGTMTLADGKFVSYEEVANPAEADGVEAVRGTGTIGGEAMSVKSEYLKEGKWIPGHTADYVLAPDAEVKFK